MLKRTLILILLTSLASTQFSFLQAMEQKPELRGKEIDEQLDNCCSKLSQFLLSGASAVLNGTGRLIQTSWRNRRKVVLLFTAALVIQHFATAQAAPLSCSNETYIEAIKQLVSKYFSSIEEGNICTDKGMEENPIFCAIAYGHECDQEDRTYASALRDQYTLLYKGIRDCIDSYYYDQEECLNNLSEEVLKFITKKNN